MWDFSDIYLYSFSVYYLYLARTELDIYALYLIRYCGSTGFLRRFRCRLRWKIHEHN